MITFSGVQPSGIITIGNYLGAIQNFNPNSSKENNLYCIVNLHALTSNPDPLLFKEQTKSLLALYIALGIDQHSTIFIQSQVKEHTELAWILQTLVKMGELERMTQYKDKSNNNKENANAGLFTYPVLMAADILLYNSETIPVGQDQLQHIELARTLATRFNNKYQEIFKLPVAKLNKKGAKIYSLNDPLKKMSKSDPNPKSYISILDDLKTITKKIKSSTTDSLGEINYDIENQPGISNLLTIYSLCKNITIDQTIEFFKDQKYSFLKENLIEAIWQILEPIQDKYYQIIDNQKIIDQVLKDGQKIAKQKAEIQMKKVNKVVGLYD